jgi:hypothetical protein
MAKKKSRPGSVNAETMSAEEESALMEQEEVDDRAVRYKGDAETGPDPIDLDLIDALTELESAVTAIGEFVIRTVHPNDAPRLRAAFYPPPVDRGDVFGGAEVRRQAARLNDLRAALVSGQAVR